MSLKEYLTDKSVWAYLVNNIFLISNHFDLPGVFEKNATHSANGSLWTLRYEVLMYIVVMIAGVIGGVRFFGKICVAILILCIGIWIINESGNFKDFSIALKDFLQQLQRLTGFSFTLSDLTGNGIFFFSGSCYYIFRTRIKISLIGAFALCFVFQWAATTVMVTSIMLWVILPYVIMVLAYYLGKPARYLGDFDASYGVYIYSFPITQLICAIALHSNFEWYFIFLCSLGLTMVMAAASWYWIERPALLHKSRWIGLLRTRENNFLLNSRANYSQ